MEYTGERIVPEVMKPKNGMLKEHIARYEFASQYCYGRVLDLGCGVGYGAEILLDLDDENTIQQVVGVDFDAESIQYAKEMYGYLKTEFIQADARSQKLHQELGSFDCIICYEMIEHLLEDELVIRNIAKMLNPRGFLMISTPFGKGKGKPCASPFHVHQYLEKEFVELLEPYFDIEMYHQVDVTIEKPVPGKKYYLMLAICRNKE
ncbi:MAG: class I SAM-dependent methyltransferase [Tindallia sp. MSAO_Bac2]|nr:MAG: class I SAM-dependent methyltransferase [Tindallia sp. MSAO_Bac2]